MTTCSPSSQLLRAPSYRQAQPYAKSLYRYSQGLCRYMRYVQITKAPPSRHESGPSDGFWCLVSRTSRCLCHGFEQARKAGRYFREKTLAILTIAPDAASTGAKSLRHLICFD